MKRETLNRKVEDLVKGNAPTADSIKAAIAKRDADRQAEQTERIIVEMETIDASVDESVAILRAVRVWEKQAKKNLEVKVSAREEYTKTADYVAYQKAMRDVVRIPGLYIQ